MAENDAQGEWALPNGWVWTTLGEVRVDESYSITPKKTPEQFFELYSVPRFADGKPKIVKGEQIGSSKRVVQEKAVLLCKINPRINRVWVVGNHSPWPKIGSAEWMPFFHVDGIEPEYLCYFMQQNDFRDFLALHASGVGGSLMRVKPTTFTDYPFPLAPLPEQRRIVAEIETQFTRLDAAVAALERAQANLRRYRAAVLKAACEGRLVPTEAELARAENRDYEPADQLLTRILAERRARWEADYLEKQRAKGKEPKDDRWKQKYKEPASPDTENLLELPEGWTWATVEQISKMTQYGTSEKANLDPSGIPVLRMGNIQSGELDFGNLKYFPWDWPKLDDFLLQNGDVLFNRTNSAELVGKTAVYKRFHPRAVFASYLIRVRTYSDFLPDLLSFYINSFYGRRYIASVVSQQVGQANVSGTKLSRMSVVLPPVAEQRRIVAEVERRLSVVAALEREVEAALARAARLRQAILKRAFEGRLVPQDPGDEPALVLLERIRAEKAGRAVERKAKRKGSRKKRRKPEQSRQLEMF